MSLDGLIKATDPYRLLVFEVFTRENRTLYLYNRKGELVWT